MKGLGLIFILSVTLCFTVVGQDKNSDNFNFGFKGGININGFTNEHTDLNTLFSAGIFSDYYFYKNFGISVEINYIQRGGILRQIVPKPIFENTYYDFLYAFDLYVKNNYLEFPILFKYKTAICNEILLLPSIGVSYSIPVPFQNSSSIKNKKVLETNGLPRFTGQSSYEGAEKSILIGLNFGAALIINRFIVELRYYRSFNEIKGTLNVGELKYQVHSFQILMGYTI